MCRHANKKHQYLWANRVSCSINGRRRPVVLKIFHRFAALRVGGVFPGTWSGLAASCCHTGSCRRGVVLLAGALGRCLQKGALTVCFWAGGPRSSGGVWGRRLPKDRNSIVLVPAGFRMKFGPRLLRTALGTYCVSQRKTNSRDRFSRRFGTISRRPPKIIK